MKFEETNLKGAYIVSMQLIQDQRGAFARTYCKKEFEEIGHNKEFVQINQSYNNIQGTIRGMHFQLPPYQEIKLIRCIKGSALDIIIDLRKNSKTFLHYFATELSAQNKRAIYVPENFAHGFQTLEDNTELIYQHTEFYTTIADTGFRYDDPALKIEWKLPPTAVSDKDNSYRFIDSEFKGF